MAAPSAFSRAALGAGSPDVKAARAGWGGDRHDRVFSEGHYDLCLGFDPQVGFALVGVHEPDGEPKRLCAYDMLNKRVAWESLSGEASDDIDDEKLACADTPSTCRSAAHSARWTFSRDARNGAPSSPTSCSTR